MAWQTTWYVHFVKLRMCHGMNNAFEKQMSRMRSCHKAWEMCNEGMHATLKHDSNINDP